eukprot:CAMPEP_0118948038 /NCGR_PEP_ID=MMETSP1169-20130426/47148_1 /TAXON_ID=36882 /ORGANISM="Pyramimonas obovata, Strain CCMP722" /LENGTH=40 /DNA_ID= /DNA_START= /DNA_END= /DNA_ORIENTATION=
MDTDEMDRDDHGSSDDDDETKNGSGRALIGFMFGNVDNNL